MSPKFRTLENAVILRLYKIISDEGFEGWDETQIMKNLFKDRISQSYAKKIFKQVIDEGHVTREVEQDTNEKYLTLTGRGIKHVEEMLDNDSSEIFRLNRDGLDKIFGEEDTSPPNLKERADQWRKPDSIEILSASSVIEVRSHISQAMQIIAESQFTQEEKAQIRGLLQICENILDLPVPKIGFLRRLIEMMRGIKEISEIIETILRVIQ